MVEDSDFWNFGCSDFHISRYPGFQILCISNFGLSDFRISRFSNVLVFLIFKISDCQIFWFWDLGIFRSSDSHRAPPPATPLSNVEGSSSTPVLCWRASRETNNIELGLARGVGKERCFQTDGGRMQKVFEILTDPVISPRPWYQPAISCVPARPSAQPRRPTRKVSQGLAQKRFCSQVRFGK